MTDSKARTSLRRRRRGAPDASRGDAGDDARLFRLLRIGALESGPAFSWLWTSTLWTATKSSASFQSESGRS